MSLCAVLHLPGGGCQIVSVLQLFCPPPLPPEICQIECHYTCSLKETHVFGVGEHICLIEASCKHSEWGNLHQHSGLHMQSILSVISAWADAQKHIIQ